MDVGVNRGEDDVAADPAARVWRTWPTRGMAVVDRHPFLVVAVVAGLGALVSGWWVWNARHLGAYDPDEAGHLANALRYQRATDPTQPSLLWDEVSSTPTAPLVPLLSAALMTIGTRDVRTAMLLSPILMVTLAVAGAGITRRLAGARWAVVAGVTMAGLPTIVLASQAYLFGLAAGTACALAMWALLASERLSNRWTWAFGLALGALPLCRTMAIAFVPGLVLAALVLAGRDRARLRRLGLAVVLAVLVAGPWWWAERHDIWTYLVGYSYGDRSVRWGEASMLARIRDRLGVLSEGVTVPVVAGLLIAAAAVLADRLRPPWPVLTPAHREALALTAAVGVGWLALLTPRNEGLWFDTPVIALTVPLGVAVLGRVRRRELRSVIAVGLLVVTAISPVWVRVVGYQHLSDALVDHDPRFEITGPTRPDISGEWWDVNLELAAEVRSRTDGDAEGVFVTGNSFLLNSNTVDLAAELDQWTSRLGVIDSFAGADIERELDLARLLVVVRRDVPTFTPDVRWREVEATARRSGWTEVWSRDLPHSGEVVILASPEFPPSPGG